MTRVRDRPDWLKHDEPKPLRPVPLAWTIVQVKPSVRLLYSSADKARLERELNHLRSIYPADLFPGHEFRLVVSAVPMA